MKKILLALALLVMAAAPAAAQPEPSAGEVQAVREFLQVTRTSEVFSRTLEIMLQDGAMGEEMPEEFGGVMREFFAEHFRYEDLEPGFIRMYTDLFTEQELRDLIAFYRTPTGQRMVELTPEITARTQQLTTELMEEAMPALMEMMMEAFEEEEGEEEPQAEKAPPSKS